MGSDHKVIQKANRPLGRMKLMFLLVNHLGDAIRVASRLEAIAIRVEANKCLTRGSWPYY